MKEIDRRAREEFCIPELILMEHAGKAAAQAARRLYPKRGRAHAHAGVSLAGRARPVLVLCGAGANGGDGFVAARHLDNRGIPVRAVLVGDPGRVGGAAQVNLRILKPLGVPVTVVSSRGGWSRWRRQGMRAAVIVDALLGTGVSGELREPVRSAIGWVNRQRCPVVSVDLPSGLSADTGRPCGVGVRATVTVTCGLPKQGLGSPEGRRWAGRVEVADISLPRALRPWKH